MSNERHRTRDLEQLSAYLDHALRDRQIRQLESRLQREPALREQLENLRQTKLLMSQLPRMRAPRNFTLTPDMVKVRQPQKRPMFFSLKLATSLAAIFLVALFGVEFFLGGNLAEQTHMASEPMAEEAQMDAAEKPAPLIIWSEGGQGGGGAEGSPYGMGGGESIALEVPVEEWGTMPEVEMIAPEAQEEESAKELDEESMTPEAPVEEERAMPEAEMIAPQAQEEESTKELGEESALTFAEDSTNTNPILGLNPDEGGQIIESSKPGEQLGVDAANWPAILRWAQVSLAGIAVAGALMLLIMHIKRVRIQ
jgi:hypothetical protein